MAWLCIFAPQHFIDFYSKQAQSLLRAFPWGGRPFCPLGEGKNHMWSGDGCWSPPPGSMFGLRVGTCLEVSARETILRAAELSWT